VHAEMHMRWNREGFEVLLRELARKEDVQYLAILDESGTILAHSDPKQTGQRSPSLSNLTSLGGEREILPTLREGSIVTFGRRLKGAGGPRAPMPGEMESMQGRTESANPWPRDMEKLVAVAAIRVTEFDKIHQQAYRQEVRRPDRFHRGLGSPYTGGPPGRALPSSGSTRLGL